MAGSPPRPSPGSVTGLRGKRNIRVLSIDGGGIRGLIPALMLEHIEKSTGRRLCELFDIIAGTSTGGLLAMLCAMPDAPGSGRPNPATAGPQLVGLYNKRGIEIFPPVRTEREKSASPVPRDGADKSPRGVAARVSETAADAHHNMMQNTKVAVAVGKWVATGPKYTVDKQSTGNLEGVLRDYCVLQGRWLSLTDCVVPVFISTVETAQPWGPCFFSTLDARADSGPDGYNYRLLDVARATSAAPTFLPPVKLRNYSVRPGADLSEGRREMTCIDGGVCCNNPSLAVYNYVRSISDPGAQVTVVSLGTGLLTRRFTKQEMDGFGLARWVEPLIDTMMSGTSQLMSDQLDLLSAADPRTVHHRFQVPIPEQYTAGAGKASVGKGVACEEMDNTQPANLSAMARLTQEYLQKEGARLTRAVQQCQASPNAIGGGAPPAARPGAAPPRGGYSATRPGY